MGVLLELYLTFAKIGLFTFGGGYAMLPILEKEIVDKKGWATNEELLDYYAIGQSTPGVIAINTSTFCGVKQAGNIGGIVASLGFVTPAIIIITIIAGFLKNFSEISYVKSAFAGIRIAVCALVVYSVVKMIKQNADTASKFIVFLVTFLAIAFFDVSPVILVLVVAGLGIGIGRVKNA